MSIRNPGLHILDNNERPANAPAVGSDVDSFDVLVDVNRHKLRHAASAAQATEVTHKLGRATRDTQDEAVKEDDVGTGVIKLRAGEEVDVFFFFF